MDSHQHVAGESTTAGARARRLSRDGAFGCRPAESSCFGPGKRNLNDRLFAQSDSKDFCWLHTQGRVPPTPRAGTPAGGKQQSPGQAPRILLGELQPEGGWWEESWGPASESKWDFSAGTPAQGRTRRRDLSAGSSPAAPVPVPRGFPSRMPCCCRLPPESRHGSQRPRTQSGEKALPQRPRQWSAPALGRRRLHASGKPLI